MATRRLHTLSRALVVAVCGIGCGSNTNSGTGTTGAPTGSGSTPGSGAGGTSNGVLATGGRSTIVTPSSQGGTGNVAGGTTHSSQGGAGTGGATLSTSMTGGTSSMGTGGATGGAKASGGSEPGSATGGAKATGGSAVGGSTGITPGSGGSGVGGSATGGTKANGGSGVGGATVAGGSSGNPVATTVTIKPGGTWNDTSGTPIQAHGGGFLKVGDTWYWVGEDKTTNTGGSGFFYAVSIYASKDLVTWEHRNKIITTATDPLLASNRIIERPKIIYNDKTKMYVMWAHWDDTSYTSSSAGIFKSATIDGNYSYVDHIKPGGHDSRDCTLFKDDDGTAYFIGVGNNNSDLWVYPLSDDYLSVKSGSIGTDIFPSQWREAPAIVKISGTYYLITSWSSGWNPNQGAYSTASSITGPWAALKNIGDSTTYQSQSTYIITVQGTQSTTYIFAGDRWNSSNLSKSQYVWWPLTINGKTMSLTNYTQWSLNLGTGVWSAN